MQEYDEDRLFGRAGRARRASLLPGETELLVRESTSFLRPHREEQAKIECCVFKPVLHGRFHIKYLRRRKTTTPLAIAPNRLRLRVHDLRGA